MVSLGCLIAFVALVVRDAMRRSAGDRDDDGAVDAVDVGGLRTMEWIEGAFWTYFVATVGVRIGEFVAGDAGATVMSCVAVAVVHGKAFAFVACAFVACFARLVRAAREAPFSMARKRAAVFLVVVGTFVVIDAAERTRGGTFLGGYDGMLSAGTFTRWRAARYDVLRWLSFGIDCVEDAETPCSIGRCLRYVFYPPCRQVGPVVMYRDFKRPGVARTWAGKAYAMRELLDVLAWHSMMRTAYVTFYHPLNPPMYPNRDDGLFNAVVFTWTHATALWAQSVIVFNSAHALCVLEGSSDAIRDVSQFWTTSATSFTHFWRHFHVSLHEYFVVYVHRPTRGTWASVTFAFAFSILFHGASSAQWRGFFAVQTFGVLAERACRRRFDAFGDSTRQFVLRIAYQTVLMCLFTAGAVPTVRLDARVFVAHFVALFVVQTVTLDRDAPNDVDDGESSRGVVGESGGEPEETTRDDARAQTTGARRLRLRLRRRRQLGGG